MGLRGVIRGRTIELEQEPPLPDGTQVEVELRTLLPDPLWGPLADQSELIEALRQMMQERSIQLCRTPDETCHPLIPTSYLEPLRKPPANPYWDNHSPTVRVHFLMR